MDNLLSVLSTDNAQFRALQCMATFRRYKGSLSAVFNYRVGQK